MKVWNKQDNQRKTTGNKRIMESNRLLSEYSDLSSKQYEGGKANTNKNIHTQSISQPPPVIISL